MRLAAATFALIVTAMPGAAQGFDPSHAAWTALLGRHVVVLDGGKASRVRYSGFARDRVALDAYLGALAAVTRPQFERWPRAEQMAFLINTYNARMVQKVLTRYPDLRSVWDFGRFFGNPFKDDFFTLLGRKASLDDVEGMLREPGAYDDPRVHFALNCASVGCPMLRPQAYVGAKLDSQLEDQARRFLTDRSRNRYDAVSGRLEVSRIFDWYERDWPPRYLERHAALLADDAAARARIAAGGFELGYLDYDWTLNDAKE